MKQYKTKITGILFFIIGILFMGIGLLRKEQITVLKKAVNICLECIGIG